MHAIVFLGRHIIRLTNTSQAGECPGDKVAYQHHMIAAVHTGICLVSIPKFPYRGGTVLDHISPRGIGTPGGKQPCHIGETIVAERGEEPRSSDDTSGDMTAMTHQGGGNEILDHLLTQAVGNHAEGKRKDIGGCSIVAIIDAVGIKRVSRRRRCVGAVGEEDILETGGQPLSLSLPHDSVGGMACKRGIALHQLHHPHHISRGNEAAVGLSGGVLAVNKFQ